MAQEASSTDIERCKRHQWHVVVKAISDPYSRMPKAGVALYENSNANTSLMNEPIVLWK